MEEWLSNTLIATQATQRAYAERFFGHEQLSSDDEAGFACCSFHSFVSIFDTLAELVDGNHFQQ
jgi:hypothetical protein